MIDFDNIKEIWQTISRNKTRSLMTAFGVFWGVFILVVLLSCGNGFRNGLMRQIEGFATNSAFLWTMPTSEAYKGYQKNRYWEFDLSDIQAIKDNVTGIDIITPVTSFFSYNGENNVFYSTKGGSFGVKGIRPEYNEIERCKLLYGRFINETDIVEERKVCVVGKKVYDDIIGIDKDPIGLMIKANGIYYQIVGVVQSYNENVNINGELNSIVLLPITTMQKAYHLGDKFGLMCFTASKGFRIKEVAESIKDVVRERHCISPTDNEAVTAIDFEQMFNMFENLFIGIIILIWIVGIGTLMSGVVGVSNIMLVTIKERTREIGIRRALGAKPSLIIKQIFEESLLLTLLAGIVGLVIGVAAMSGVANLVGKNPSETMMFLDPNISFGTAVIATIIVITSGLLAGALPAKRAIQIKAIDAIREE